MIAGNGYDTTRSIRMNHNWDRLPIIALTTHALEGDEEKCRAAGCNHYLTNLFTLHQLSAAIAYCLETASKPEGVDQNLFDSEVFRVLKEEFLVSLKGMVDDLEMANLNHDLDAMRSTTHDIKGSAGIYGYHEISVLAAELNAQINSSKQKL